MSTRSLIALIPWMLVAMLSCAYGKAREHEFNINGQFSGWMLVNDRSDSENQLGLRYIPEMIYERRLTSSWQLSGAAAVNVFDLVTFHTFRTAENDHKLDLYRLWLRLSADQFELRAGLQKINFGAALLLRPLMWFDQLDPRDPLQLTAGVYGLLGRYYFLNNANVWLWGLYGNDDLKGWEVLPTKEKSIEFGGRIQYPFTRGELGLTYHQRDAEVSPERIGMVSTTGEQRFIERRYAVDTKWDLEIGVWLESALIHRALDVSSLKYQQLTTLGMDYTFGIGNGLHCLAEHMRMATAERLFREQESYSITALLLDYPMTVMDQLVMMLYYDQENEDIYRFLHWQRLYDNLSLHLIGFINPANNMLYDSNIITNPFSGKGFQIMLVYNH
ncbi:hypothetical protein JXB12_07735 [candidate division KSB1 bacterium]|nr:hypothetical protein [candidate division KSB1 bacterium]